MNMQVDDVDSDIRAAMATHAESVDDPIEIDSAPSEEPTKPEVTEPKDNNEPRDDKGRFKQGKPASQNKLQLKQAPQTKEAGALPVVTSASAIEAPVSLSPSIKSKWGSLPADVQAEWAKRENDIHQMFTRHDGELRMGREMKDVIQPYMPLIAAEGGTPAKAVQSLLNTAYLLRTGTPQQKATLLQQTAQQFGVDLGQIQQTQEYQDPTILQLQQQIMNLQNQLEPHNVQNYLQSHMESSKIESEVTAFASDPANVHYKQVAPVMAALLSSGRAENLKEAYEAACYADHNIRSTLLAEQSKQADEKRKSELAAKKKAGVSISGSPGSSGNSSTKSENSIEDDVRSALQASSGRI